MAAEKGRPIAAQRSANPVVNEAVEIALKACEARCGFWKAIAYATSGALVGLVVGAAPMAWRDLATQQYVDSRVAEAPWTDERALVLDRIGRTEEKNAEQSVELAVVRSSLSELNGNVATLLTIMTESK